MKRLLTIFFVQLAISMTYTALAQQDITLDGDSITRIYFNKNEDAYQTVDIEASDAGSHLLQLTSTSSTGLPDISSLRVFPLEGQPVPVQDDLTGITRYNKNMSARRQYLNLNGIPSSQPHRGINIVRETINGKNRSYTIVKL